jgi:hypothetical protein
MYKFLNEIVHRESEKAVVHFSAGSFVIAVAAPSVPDRYHVFLAVVVIAG